MDAEAPCAHSYVGMNSQQSGVLKKAQNRSLERQETKKEREGKEFRASTVYTEENLSKNKKLYL